MKILLSNIAIRNKPDPFPPVACTSLLNVLKRNGYDPIFFDIDAKRPSPEELFDFFKKEKFDLVGISAVVSTGYQYTKNLASIIKNACPDTKIILGGNLAAAYKIVLRKCPIDLCVIGEGERVLLNLVRYLDKYRTFKPPREELLKIKGVVFLDSQGACKFTGHEELICQDEIEEPDYELLNRFSVISQYIYDPLTRADIVSDPRTYETKRRSKKLATIFTSKGCINSCTFCHRWIKGYRVIPLEKVISTMKYLIDKYNVGFFCISDECFGEDRQWLEQFIAQVKPLDILFQIGGARVSLVKKDPTIMWRLKDAGLTAIYFGIESGSDKILKVMEKNASKAENIEAIKKCSEADIFTVIQLVIGMPGENDFTISETIEFIKKATEELPFPPLVAVNYLQALPGTSCYEFLRHNGLLGKTIEDEEQYLLRISDINAGEFRQYLNVSEGSLPKVKLWRIKIHFLPMIHWLKLHRWKLPDRQDRRFRDGSDIRVSIKALFKENLKNNIWIYRIIDICGERFWKAIFTINRFSIYGIRKTSLILLGIKNDEERVQFKIQAESLREFTKINECS
jgi:radical SAM superfamily enzyme YgiQ (UPF0313 family)